MATRTQVLTNTLLNIDNTPNVGAPVSCYLQTPDGVPVINLEGGVLFNGQLYGEGTVTDNLGTYSMTAVYTGDLRVAATGATTTCQLVVTENGVPVTSPIGYAYAASITVSAWYPTSSTANTTLMLLSGRTVANVAAQNVPITLDISANAIRPDASVILVGSSTALVTDASGNITALLTPSSLLNPTTTAYTVAFPNGTVWDFLVPVNPTGYQGAYNAGTTYNPNAGTFASPADVVLSGGILYQSILTGAGHTPASSPTFWKVFPGEPIDWHITATAGPGDFIFTTATIAHDSTVPALADDAVAAPGSLSDDLHNLATRVPGARRSISTSVAINAVTDDNLFASAAGGAIAPTLPLASARTRKYYIIKTDNVANVTVTATGGNTINGAATLVLSTQYQWAVLESDGTSAWYAQTGTGGGGASTFSFASFSANHSIVTSDSGLAGDGTSGSVVFSLPTAIGATQVYAVKAINLTHPVSVATAVGGQTIDGASSVSLGTVGQVLVFASDNANWRIESGYSPNPITGLGDLIVGLAGGVATRLGVGADGYVLTADSSQSTGLKWQAGGGGGSGSGTRLAILDGSSSPPVAAWNDAGTDFVYLDPTTP